MKKKWLTAIICCVSALAASSQTLFTYGSDKGDAKEFLRAFDKNNQQPASARAKAMREYLDLYINSRLKIREAYSRGYDTLPQIKSEVEILRNQIIENYMSEPETIDRLTREAYQRSQKDIHLAHIFISAKDAMGVLDTLTARKNVETILQRLSKGEDFQSLAQELSDDPAARQNRGDLEYITVFTLPYEFENIAYSLAPGKYSAPHLSRNGYHLFKNLGERKALGKIKIQQILLAFSPGMDDAGKKSIARLADSLYQQILKGEDFGRLAAAYSNDYVSAAADGNIPDVGVGQYEGPFEKAIWSLKDKAVSPPFVSSHGYHIVKRVEATPIVTDPANKANNEYLQQRVLNDDRWKTAKDFIYTRVKKKGYQRYPYSDATLWALSDSLLDYKPVGLGRGMNIQSALFKMGDTIIRVSDWINYAQGNRYKSDRTGLKSYPDLMDEFSKQMMYQYYRSHLEEFNVDFKNQMAEFKEGNLFFEIMQQEVWNKAQADSAALIALYEKNKDQYKWKPSADAVIFFCSDEATAKSLYELVKKNPADWRKIIEPMSERVVADSARYEWSQLPGLSKGVTPKNGTVTSMNFNKTDKTASFAFIQQVYTKPTHRSFSEARGLVMNDYQDWLEKEWIKELKKKYPVTIDQAVFSKISKLRI